jgi:hypothetical protein
VLAVVTAIHVDASSRAELNPRCNPQHTLTLAINNLARVYGNLGDRAFACLNSSGLTRGLSGASASQDVFALGGDWVAWTSVMHTTVNVMYISNGAIPQFFPNNTNDYVVTIVVKNDGAAAWAANPSSGAPYVQGMDRKGHSPDTFSDDTKSVRGSTLQSWNGKKIAWRYTDGGFGTTNLF